MTNRLAIFTASLGRRVRKLSLIIAAGVLVAAVLSLGTTTASAATPWWHIVSETSPTNLPAGGEGVLILHLTNLGDAPIDGSPTPVVLSSTLSDGLVATEISGGENNRVPVECALSTLSCSFKGLVYPYEPITISIKVKVEEPTGTVMSLSDHASVAGGGAPPASSTVPVPISDTRAPFGLASYSLGPFNEDGTPATQAGAHPFELVTSLVLNQIGREPVELPKDLNFRLPPGLVGNPTAVAQCTMANFFALVSEANLCAPATVVGVATVTANEPRYAHVITAVVPVFNLVPAQGEPARLGFEVIGKIPVVIDTSVRSGRDYGVDATVKEATQTAGVLSSVVTLWGVPGDPRHDNARGWECVDNETFAKQVGKPCPTSPDLEQQPFLMLPTSCAVTPGSEPVVSSAEADSWPAPGSFVDAQYEWLSEAGVPLGFEGCGQLPFSPSIDVVPEEHTAATPSGVSVQLSVPQKTTLEAGGLAEADVRDTTITLPAGVDLSPSAANGLAACSEAQVGFEGFDPASGMQQFSAGEAACPEASKVGVVHIKTPLLSHELEGSVFLASPAPNGEAGINPFGSLVALYLVARDPVSGVLVKLAGEGQLDENTLQVATTFRDAPEVPFEDLKVDLFGGPRASVSTPATCGAFTTEGLLTPWSGTGPVGVQAPAEDFQVSSGVGGGACPSGALPFSPGFDAFSTSTQAGAFTGFQLELTRSDGDQALSSVSMHLPPGNAALLSSVALCEEPQAANDECPASSEVGQATAVAGLGSEPYVETGGRVFITGPYKGAPFGLEVVTPAVAGPFNLGFVTVRSKLLVNPNNASVTVVSDPLPTQLRGIPLQLKRVIVDVDRPGFEFNPTNCNPMSVEGTIGGSEGASAGVSSPFQVGGCGALPFGPKLTATAGGRGSKADGTSLAVRVESGGVGAGGVVQAGIAKVDLQLPLALSSRLPTLQKACLEAVFNADPASCDEGSVIGEATIHTPVLKSALTGPAYLVSHGGAEFPDVEFVLQGEGITLVLDGKTDIKHGITYSKFESAPDAPFTVFETELPAGPHGVLAPNVPEKEDFSLCKASLAMPTEITAQNGAVLDQTTNIAVTGCGGVLPSKTVKPTRVQLLAKALKACRKDKHKRKRLACEKQARKRYAPKKPAHRTAHKARTVGQHSR
jgi:hypothetical protein